MKIAVTGANGKLGLTVVRELREHGHEVVAIDILGRRESGFVRVDLTDYGQVVDVLAGVDGVHSGLDAVVHLGAVPAPGLVPDSETFRNNILATFNVFQACRRAAIRTIVSASSETVLGLPFDTDPPYIPVDEEYDTRPESVYSLTKHLEEQLALKLTRWDPQLSITSLRFSNVMNPEDYAEFPSFDEDAQLRKWNLWAYVDGRDAAQAIERALTLKRPGFDVFIVAAADTVMTQTNAELIRATFPRVATTRSLDDHETLLSIEKARRVLGYEPRFSWRDAQAD